MTNAGEAPFAGASAIIFGGAKGIGKAVALEWARRGARVAVADLDLDASRETAAEIAGEGGEAIGLACDVLSQASMETAARDAQAAFGPPDIVMNNVGAILNGHPLDIPDEEGRRGFELNYF